MRRALLFAIVAGCSFPQPTIDDISTSGDSSAVDSGVGDSAKSDVGDTTVTDSTMMETSGDSTMMETSGDTPADSSMDSVVMDSEDTKPDGPTCVKICDCDGDGDEAKGVTGCTGNDCDDGDSRRNSKVTDFQSYSLTMPFAVTHGGDWDCSGGVTKQYSIENINCGSYLNASGCIQQGYKTAATCGTTNTLVSCKAGPLTNCVAGGETSIIVKCK